tara:strand:- start:3338 stop:3778 length:441 start_codon:yes stop_codon:yes gene_type:complete
MVSYDGLQDFTFNANANWVQLNKQIDHMLEYEKEPFNETLLDYVKMLEEDIVIPADMMDVHINQIENLTVVLIACLKYHKYEEAAKMREIIEAERQLTTKLILALFDEGSDERIYSMAMVESGIKYNEDSINKFLETEYKPENTSE